MLGAESPLGKYLRTVLGTTPIPCVDGALVVTSVDLYEAALVVHWAWIADASSRPSARASPTELAKSAVDRIGSVPPRFRISDAVHTTYLPAGGVALVTPANVIGVSPYTPAPPIGVVDLLITTNCGGLRVSL